ncbi:Eco47II family restriction endonuclease [Avibacterium paragallinarum]|uniref:Eco47II family restriction endonuclease n=2 Tax=Avibacterium paragallinarum TaxID=728 RepID=UPI00397C96E1
MAMKYKLSFISDEDLYNHVKETIEKYRFFINLDRLVKNLLDPVKLTFDSAIYYGDYSNSSLEKILDNEVWRQIDKSNTNHIGYFHQNIFKYIGGDQWVVPQKGFDIENPTLGVYVEMKNKHNTMNSSSSSKTYLRMQNKILNNPQATCMLVEVIAKKSQNIEWICSVDGERLSHSSIRRVSLDKFYEFVTGDSEAFAQLCGILPKVIQDVLNNTQHHIIENTVLSDIHQKGVENILNEIYLITFKKYQGFDDFRLLIK